MGNVRRTTSAHFGWNWTNDRVASNADHGIVVSEFVTPVLDGKTMELQQLVRELHWLEWQMRVFEDRYGVLSRDFYRAMEAGELSDLDDGEEPRFHDFLEWHGLYKVWLKREQSYRQSLHRQSILEQLRNLPAAA